MWILCEWREKLGNHFSRRFGDGGKSGCFSCLEGSLLPDNESVEYLHFPYSVGRPVPELHPSQQVTILNWIASFPGLQSPNSVEGLGTRLELDTCGSARPVPMPNAPVWESRDDMARGPPST